MGEALTVNIALALVGLHHKQIRHMATDMVLVAGGITTKDFLKTVASKS